MKNEEMTGKIRAMLVALALGLTATVLCRADTTYYPTCCGGYGDTYANAYVQFQVSTSVYAGGSGAYLEDTDFNNCISWAQDGAMAVGGAWAAGNSYWTEQG